MDKRLRVGIISSVHGIHGECKVFPTTDDLKRFSSLKKVYAMDEAGHESVLAVHSVKYFKNMAILSFDGLDTPELIQKYRGFGLYVDREDAIPLREGEYYISDIIGLSVLDEENHPVGTVSEVFPTGANDVIEVKKADGKTVLFPFIKDCLIEMNLEEGFIKLSCDFMC